MQLVEISDELIDVGRTVEVRDAQRKLELPDLVLVTGLSEVLNSPDPPRHLRDPLKERLAARAGGRERQR